jgi:hypothetical protein
MRRPVQLLASVSAATLATAQFTSIVISAGITTTLVLPAWPSVASPTTTIRPVETVTATISSGEATSTVYVNPDSGEGTGTASASLIGKFEIF